MMHGNSNIKNNFISLQVTFLEVRERYYRAFVFTFHVFDRDGHRLNLILQTRTLVVCAAYDVIQTYISYEH